MFNVIHHVDDGMSLVESMVPLYVVSESSDIFEYRLHYVGDACLLAETTPSVWIPQFHTSRFWSYFAKPSEAERFAYERMQDRWYEDTHFERKFADRHLLVAQGDHWKPHEHRIVYEVHRFELPEEQVHAGLLRVREKVGKLEDVLAAQPF